MKNKEINKNILLIASGDNDALVQIYEAMRKQVYGLALGIVKDKGLAEDVMQTTFLKLKTRALQFKNNNGKAWLLKIARNTALDLLRKRREEPYEDMNIFQPQEGTDEISRATDSIVIREALEILDNTESQVVYLRLYCELKHRRSSRNIGDPSWHIWKNI